MDALPIDRVIETLNQSLNQGDWASAEIIAKVIRRRAQSENIVLSDPDKALVACAIAYQDIR